MLNRVFLVALYAGLTAGLLVAVVQHFTTTPLILKAEVYERSSSASTPANGDSAPGPGPILEHSHGDRGQGSPAGSDRAPDAPVEPEWAPGDGLERTIYTSLATIVTAVGFALMLLAGMIAAGDRIEPRRAVGWGAAAFLAVGLAPAMGLAPELPGSAAGDLAVRQLWWIATASATGIALWLLLRKPAWRTSLAGVLLLVTPHVAGAPNAEAFASTVPAEIAARFAATSLAIQAALWVTTAYFAGLFWSRTSRAPSSR